MDILIKGIHIPKEQEYDYHVIVSKNGEVYVRHQVGEIIETFNTKAVEVPTPHGRLGDLDLLCERLLHAWDTADTNRQRQILEVMADVVTPIVASHPTVIEANTEEKSNGTDR